MPGCGSPRWTRCSRRPSESVPAGEPQSLFVVPSAPADAAISISAALAPAGLERLVVTVLQPVSEHGPEAIEELESQVVKLLSFQPVSQTVFDTQVGFNMLSSYGPESGIKLADARARIANESRRYLAGPRAGAGHHARPGAGFPFARIYGVRGIQGRSGAR